MQYKRIAVILAAIWTCLPYAAQAGITQPGTVSSILSDRDGRLFFNTSGARTGAPACATAARWVINMSSSGGQIIASTVLTAYAQGKAVSVSGTGTCQEWSDTESVLNVFLP